LNLRPTWLTGDFPILIKMNGTDYMPGGIGMHNFPPLANEIAWAGVDAIEVSGGMWDCLVKHDPKRVKAAQRWLSSWVKENAIHSR
jgi:hypothetical protein